MQDELVIELHSELPEIARLAGQVQAFGVRNNVPAIAIGHVNLALDELITNAISYGVVDGRSHRIRVTLRLDHGRLMVEILDDGRPFAPFGGDDPDVTQPLEDRPIGGLGIYFVRKLMDHVDYQHVNGQNRVTLIKNTAIKGTTPKDTAPKDTAPKDTAPKT
jgi:anti-sigma regulatory factor (Ser/Thr protein kinase)